VGYPLLEVLHDKASENFVLELDQRVDLLGDPGLDHIPVDFLGVNLFLKVVREFHSLHHLFEFVCKPVVLIRTSALQDAEYRRDIKKKGNGGGESWSLKSA